LGSRLSIALAIEKRTCSAWSKSSLRRFWLTSDLTRAASSRRSKGLLRKSSLQLQFLEPRSLVIQSRNENHRYQPGLFILSVGTLQTHPFLASSHRAGANRVDSSHPPSSAAEPLSASRDFSPPSLERSSRHATGMIVNYQDLGPLWIKAPQTEQGNSLQLCSPAFFTRVQKYFLAF